MAKIRFLTDSAADIPQNYAEQYDIQVLHFPIALKDREILDGVDLSNEEFYRVLREESQIPTHAQITAFQFEETYAATYEAGYDALIYTGINFKGSNTGNNAVLAKDNFYAEHPEAEGKFEIYIIDSKTYTYSYGYAVVEGAKAAAAGNAAAGEIAAQIQDWVDHCKILFCCFDLSFARKSGRVSAAAAILGGAMGIRPVMSFPNGDSKVLFKPRGDKKAMTTMVDTMKAEMEPGSPYLLIQAALTDKNQEMQAACEEAVGYAAAEAFSIGGVIAVNAGPDLVGVVYRAKD